MQGSYTGGLGGALAERFCLTTGQGSGSMDRLTWGSMNWKPAQEQVARRTCLRRAAVASSVAGTGAGVADEFVNQQGHEQLEGLAEALSLRSALLGQIGSGSLPGDWLRSLCTGTRFRERVLGIVRSRGLAGAG